MSEVVALPTDKFTLVTPVDVCPDIVHDEVTSLQRNAEVNGERVWWFDREQTRDMVAVEVGLGGLRSAKD